MTELMEPALEFVFELRVEVAAPLPIGRSDSEDLQFTPITGGSVAGPRLTGRIVPGGGDWWVARGDTVQLDARYVLDADGAFVDVVNRGYWRAAPEVAERLFSGGQATEEELYYRTAFVFQTAAPALGWLAESQFVGYARPEPGLVCIRVFRVV